MSRTSRQTPRATIGTVATVKQLARSENSSRYAEAHTLGLRKAVILAQVPVRFHAQRAAVFVAKPTRNGENIDASFDANGCE
jgi:hypothetical protein